MYTPASASKLTANGASAREPRATCLVCRRPLSCCYCGHLPRLATDTKVLLLQHPRERDMPIGTGRMANLCLSNSELHVGVDWEGSAVMKRAISDPARPAVLLYPGDDPSAPATPSIRGPVTLIAVDGTWSQTRKMVRKNPTLSRLPRLAFSPPAPSEYRIRREPRPYCVSTIEALMFALSVLEDDPERFLALLTPFRKMIDRQIELRQQNRTVPCRHVKKEKSLANRIPSALRERQRDIVCVVGEANAWPWRSRGCRDAYPDELVHWVAHRLGTRETFEVIVAPRHPLAPHTTQHVGLTAEQLDEGKSIDYLLCKWRDFIGESDIVCSWGSYAAGLFASMGGYLPALRFDLRRVIKDAVKRNIGTLESVSLDGVDAPPLGCGRAGLRLSLLSCVAHGLCRGSSYGAVPTET